MRAYFVPFVVAISTSVSACAAVRDGTFGDEEVASADLGTLPWVTPTNGATVSGVVTMEVVPPSGTVRVPFFVDSVRVAIDEDGAPWRATWDARAATTGPHSLQAKARAADNTLLAVSTITVTVGTTPARDSGAPIADGGGGGGGDAGGPPPSDAGAPAPPPVVPSAGIWISPAEIASLPTTGDAWSRVRSAADGAFDSPALTTRNAHNTQTLAAALVAARLNDARYRTKVRDALRSVMTTALGTDTLGAARKLAAYPIAADVAGLAAFDPSFDASFRTWLRDVVRRSIGGQSIQQVHERRPNNWGTSAGASRIAAAAYLGDTTDLARAATVFRGWLGDRSAYAGFDYGDLAWQADPAHPVAINPVGARIVVSGALRNVDGVLPDDQRRAAFTWPPPRENYVWGALGGAAVQAALLRRRGFDAWGWSSRALYRALVWLHTVAAFPADGDDTWVPWLVNHAYGSSFTARAASAGKVMAWTDWTHAR